MTVNELIAELQVLSAQGHGELDVVMTKTDDYGLEEETTKIKLHLVSTELLKSSNWHIKNYWKTEKNNDTYMVRDASFLFIDVA